jgi:competence protein ComEA
MGTRIRTLLTGRIARGVAIGTVCGVIALAFGLLWRGRQGDTLVLNVQPVQDPNIIRIYVGGEVTSPGLYSLPRGSRVAEAIDAAGGLTASGDIRNVGMAAPLKDADQIIVPAKSSPTPRPAPTVAVSANSGATKVSVATAAAPDPSETVAPVAGGLIDINSADAATLESLPDIGPKLAQRIVDYREHNGPFQSIDALVDVEGISQRIVDELRPLVTIGP